MIAVPWVGLGLDDHRPEAATRQRPATADKAREWSANCQAKMPSMVGAGSGRAGPGQGERGPGEGRGRAGRVK